MNDTLSPKELGAITRRWKGKWPYKIDMYRHLSETLPAIYEKARKIPKEIGMPDKYLGNVGLSGTVSECHGLLRKEISDAVESGNRKVINNATLDFELRRLVKSYYGDEYDAVAASTCEALLNVSFETLATPPIAGRGDNYRTRYLAPLERHAHHQAGYGRPFPPRYKDLYADRGVTAGELGQMGKRLNNLDTVLVPMAGARYECHGINYHPVPLLLHVNAKATAARMRAEAAKHADQLSAVAFCGYTNPGYGYGEVDDNGTPLLHRAMCGIAEDYNIPSIVDNAAGLPFAGTDIRHLGADLMLYSMDKSAGAPTSGLAIGREATIVELSRALGVHGPRAGGLLSHGKAAFVGVDPGKESLLGMLAALRVLRERPDSFKRTCDAWYNLTVEEFSRLDSSLRSGLSINRDHNSCGVEVNYEGTWTEDRMGIPIFSIEDMYSGTSLIQSGVRAMGVISCISYDANIRMSPGL
ncbi:MAG: hypothetical protein ACLQUZ_18580, partial [Rhizomicrobium sp.]